MVRPVGGHTLLFYPLRAKKARKTAWECEKNTGFSSSLTGGGMGDKMKEKSTDPMIGKEKISGRMRGKRPRAAKGARQDGTLSAAAVPGRPTASDAGQGGQNSAGRRVLSWGSTRYVRRAAGRVRENAGSFRAYGRAARAFAPYRGRRGVCGAKNRQNVCAGNRGGGAARPLQNGRYNKIHDKQRQKTAGRISARRLRLGWILFTADSAGPAAGTGWCR